MLACAYYEMWFMQVPDIAFVSFYPRYIQDTVDGTAGSFISALHGGEVGKRAYIIAGQEEVSYTGVGFRAQAPGIHAVYQQRLIIHQQMGFVFGLRGMN